MSDHITSKPPFHLGKPGINSPGYAPRKGTKDYEDALNWTKNYWAKLFEAKKD